MISLPRDQLEVHLHLAARWVALTDTDRFPGGWRGVETSAIPFPLVGGVRSVRTPISSFQAIEKSVRCTSVRGSSEESRDKPIARLGCRFAL
jgi:hypothetical protein